MSNPVESGGVNPDSQKNSSSFQKLLAQARNILESMNGKKSPTLGSLILEANKDVNFFTHTLLWSGPYYDFMNDGKKLPIAIINSNLTKGESFAFRAIGSRELESIISLEGIGGAGYSGTVVENGTLFAPTLSEPLAMMDGRNYGPDDDRSELGYIVVVKKSEAIAHSKAAPDTDMTFTVQTKIPLIALEALFRIERTPKDNTYLYSISKIEPKSVKN